MENGGGDSLRVLVVTPFGTATGGAELWLRSVLDEDPEIWRHVVMLADGDLRTHLEALGFPVTVLPTGTSPAAIGLAGVRLLRILRSTRPQVVVCNGVKAQAAAVLPARLLGLPTVWVKHDHSFDTSLARPLGRLSSAVVAASQELGHATGQPDVQVVEPAKPVEPFRRDEALRWLTGYGYHRTERLTLATISRLVPYKGVDIAIRALAYPAAQDWQIAVIGEDDPATPGEAVRLRTLAESMGVANRVTFLGAVPDAGRCVRAFDAIGVLTRPGEARAPSQEGYSTVASEAMLGGVPVVYAGQGSVARRLNSATGRAGLVVRQADPMDTAAALGALSDPGLRRQLGEAGRRLAAQQDGPAETATRFVEILKRTARQHTIGTPDGKVGT